MADKILMRNKHNGSLREIMVNWEWDVSDGWRWRNQNQAADQRCSTGLLRGVGILPTHTAAKWFQCFLLFFSEQMLWTLHTCWVVLFLLSTTQTEPWLSSQVSKVKALSRLWMYFTLLYFSVCYITSWTYSDVLTENTTHFSILTQKTAKYINIIQHLCVHCQTLSVWSAL